MHHGDARLRRGRVRVRDRGDGAHHVIGGVGERERDRAHKRTVSVVPLPPLGRACARAPRAWRCRCQRARRPCRRPRGTTARSARGCHQRQCARAHDSCRRSRAPSTCRRSTFPPAGRGCRGRPCPCSGTSPADGTRMAARCVGHRLAVDAVAKCWHGGGPLSTSCRTYPREAHQDRRHRARRECRGASPPARSRRPRVR